MWFGGCILLLFTDLQGWIIGQLYEARGTIHKHDTHGVWISIKGNGREKALLNVCDRTTSITLADVYIKIS